MNILLLDLPVHIPTVMPYSLAMMASVLKATIDENILALDLNAKYHKRCFEILYSKKNKDFFSTLTRFESESRHHYTKLSKASRGEGELQGLGYIVELIVSYRPDVVCISFTYNSQLYFAQKIVDELAKRKIKVIVGGPADHSKLKGVITLKDYGELLMKLNGLGARSFKMMKKSIIDFSYFDKEDYFTKDVVYPVRTAISCPYKRCTFCTHHANMPYHMLELSMIKDAINKNGMKKVCFIDDDFPIVRLTELVETLKPLDVKFWMQLRPVKELIPLLPRLHESGLRSVAWGVESGCQRVLDKMQKGTDLEDIKEVLKASKQAGIRNMAYVMFGLPTETKEEFMQTVEFLEQNSMNIDLISLSVFGLQDGSRIFTSPQEFGVKEIIKTDRTLYGEKIGYAPVTGLSNTEAKELKMKIKGRINRINKIPKVINSCKEQVLNLS